MYGESSKKTITTATARFAAGEPATGLTLSQMFCRFPGTTCQI